jgi:hypothetical protein
MRVLNKKSDYCPKNKKSEIYKDNIYCLFYTI